jgi:4-amino-4-deoxy-L-arabinose transferase-like glycosyltransferase
MMQKLVHVLTHSPYQTAFAAIVLLGGLVRLWRLDGVPPGFNQDEASLAYESWALLHYGIDRNGHTWPMHFVAWGNGQSVMYSYLAMPALWFGFTPLHFRFPMALFGIATLPFMYLIGRRLHSPLLGLLSMFVLAISPWHILLSRWAIDDNLLPLFFLAGVYCLLRARDKAMPWLPLAALILGLSLYVYGVAYYIAPAMLLGGVFLLMRLRMATWKPVAVALAIFTLLAAPIVMFLAINSLRLDTLHIGPITIPRMTVRPRYEEVAIVFAQDRGAKLLHNVQTLAGLLWTQTDNQPWNVVEPYGYLYAITLPCIVAGLVLLFVDVCGKHSATRYAGWLVLWWLVLALGIGFLQEANINRLTLLFPVLFMGMAYLALWLYKRWRYSLFAIVVAGLIGLCFFMRAYFNYPNEPAIASRFFAGLVPALRHAAQNKAANICVTGSVNMPYVFALMADQTAPAEFARTVEYIDPQDPFRKVRRFTRFTFGPENCNPNFHSVWVMLHDEPVLPAIAALPAQRFEFYKVYAPNK